MKLLSEGFRPEDVVLRSTLENLLNGSMPVSQAVGSTVGSVVPLTFQESPSGGVIEGGDVEAEFLRLTGRRPTTTENVNALITAYNARLKKAIDAGNDPFRDDMSKFIAHATWMGGAEGFNTAKQMLSTSSSWDKALDNLVATTRTDFQLGAFQHGGIVPGPPGRAQLAVVHGQEELIPAGRGFVGGSRGGATVNLYLENHFETLDGESVRRVAEGELMDIIVEQLKAISIAGDTVAFSTGITIAPTQ